jgi:hypothetical protein
MDLFGSDLSNGAIGAPASGNFSGNFAILGLRDTI